MIKELSYEEEVLVDYLISMLKSPVLQHVDLSDTGLTEGILLKLSKTINTSTSLLSVHLSGNPGLKDHIIRKIQGKL